MRGWKDLEVVETIYEEDHEEEEDGGGGSNSLPHTSYSSTTPTPPLSSSSPAAAPPQTSPSLESIVESWAKATGCDPDVIIRVQDQCFSLHKGPLSSQSRYLKRRLTESSDVTLAPPSPLAASAFAAAARFCYSAASASIAAEDGDSGDCDGGITPSTLALLWTAAAWLDIPEAVQRTEDYFRRDVAGDATSAAAALRACLPGAAEPAAALLAVRCVEVLATADGGHGGEWIDDVASLPARDFRSVAESMASWFAHDHDLLYRIVDRYLETREGEVKEEERVRLCYLVSCSKLSQRHLVHLVRNPRMPLRFVIQAMLFEQVHTRHSLLEFPAMAAAAKSGANRARGGGLTLGEILQRDAAARETAHIQAVMEATSFRIESLERDLAGMRRQVRWSEEKRAELDAARTESCRFEGPAVGGSSGTSRSGRGFRRKLVDGLKSVFRASPTKAEVDNGIDEGGDPEVEERKLGRRKNHSFTL